MNILDYLNSDDVKKYLAETEYEFSAPEAAYIVNRCGTASLGEKLCAFRRIINDFPDCTLGTYTDSPYKASFHEALAQYISLQEKKLEAFASSDNLIYECRLRTDCISKSKLFSSFEKCIEYMQSIFCGFWETSVIYARKTDDAGEPFCAHINRSLSITDITVPDNFLTWEEQKLDTLFASMYINIPVPFRRGDLVTAAPRAVFDGGIIYALDYLPPVKTARRENSGNVLFDLPKFHENEMYAAGCCFICEGLEYSEICVPYTDLVFYRGDAPLAGKYAFIEEVAKKIRCGDEIDIKFLNNYHRAMCETELNELRKRNNNVYD